MKKGSYCLMNLRAMLDEKVKLVAVNYVSNSLGTINPVRDIIELAHKQNIPVLLDAAQAIQHMPVDVQELDVDFLAFSGHKMYGPNRYWCFIWQRKMAEPNASLPGWGRNDQDRHF